MYAQKKCITFHVSGDKRMYVCKVITKDDKEFFLTFQTPEAKCNFMEAFDSQTISEEGVFLNRDSVKILHFYEKDDIEHKNIEN